MGSRGDSYDNALAETINGLYKAELIHRRGPWKTREAVELATLHDCVKQRAIDSGARDSLSTEARAYRKALECEVKELRRTKRSSSRPARFSPGGARPPTQVLIDFIDRHRDTFGVEPICKLLQIAHWCYRRHAARRRNPHIDCDRAKRDHKLIPEIQRVWHVNWQVYGANKVWKQMNREGLPVARCTVERLMRKLGHGHISISCYAGSTERRTMRRSYVPCGSQRNLTTLHVSH